MRNHVRLLGSALVVCAAVCGGYWAFSPGPSVESSSGFSAIDSFGACTEAILDRNSGKTLLGFCPAQGIVTLTAGLH
jgi:hypothetical protein